MNSSTSGVRLIALRFVLCLVLLQQTGNCMHLGNPFNKLKSPLKFGSCSGREQIHPEFRRMDEKEFKESVVDIFFPTKEVLRSRVAKSHNVGARKVPPLPDYFEQLKDTPEWQARITKIAGDSSELNNDERWPPKHVHPDPPVPFLRGADPLMRQILSRSDPSRPVNNRHDFPPDTLDPRWLRIMEFLGAKDDESYRARPDGAWEFCKGPPTRLHHMEKLDRMDSWDQIKIRLKIDLGLLDETRGNFKKRALPDGF